MPWTKRSITSHDILRAAWAADPDDQEFGSPHLSWPVGGCECECGGYLFYFGDFGICRVCLTTYEWSPEAEGRDRES